MEPNHKVVKPGDVEHSTELSEHAVIAPCNHIPESLSRHVQVGRLFQQRWVIQRFIGRGGYGFVFKAHDSLLNTDVAIKFDVDCIDTSLFEEYQVQSYLQKHAAYDFDGHSVPKVYLFSTFEHISFVVFDLLGKSLSDFSEGVRRLTHAEVCQVGIRLLHILEFIHRMGVVHHDIKPENILLPPDEMDFSKVRLIDFGVARRIFDIDGRAVHDAQRCLGTIDFMSRAAHSGAPVTPGDDVESLAYSLLELFTGSLPWASAYEKFEDEEEEIAVFSKKCELMKNIPAEALCREVPQLQPFVEYIHTMDMNYPPYNELREILVDVQNSSLIENQ